MFQVTSDILKNRLYIQLSEFMPDESVAEAADKVIDQAKKLKPGFGVINDISTFKPGTPKAAEEIKRAQLFLKNNGVGHVVRIVGKSVIAAMQLNHMGKEAGYEADVVSSREEAEAYLDKVSYQNKLS